jgi:hypothetical protein
VNLPHIIGVALGAAALIAPAQCAGPTPHADAQNLGQVLNPNGSNPTSTEILACVDLVLTRYAPPVGYGEAWANCDGI